MKLNGKYRSSEVYMGNTGLMVEVLTFGGLFHEDSF